MSEKITLTFSVIAIIWSYVVVYWIGQYRGWLSHEQADREVDDE